MALFNLGKCSGIRDRLRRVVQKGINFLPQPISGRMVASLRA
jgi:hypothetical protein